MEVSSSSVVSSSESETSTEQNGEAMHKAEEVTSTKPIANGTAEAMSNEETSSDMDALLDEESERLDKVMSQAKEKQKENNTSQVSYNCFPFKAYYHFSWKQRSLTCWIVLLLAN